MEDFLLTVILAGLFIRWIVLSRRMASLQERLNGLELRCSAIPALQARLAILEAGEPVAVSPAKVVIPKPVEEFAPPAAQQPTRVFCTWCGRPLASPTAICPCRVEEIEPTEAAPLEPEPEPLVVPVREPVPSIGDRVRERMRGQEWEAVVGGNWLNKAGMLVLVIGIALFLGYSFTQLGPAGRSAMALAVSLAMLGGGILCERRSLYQLFGRGLIGGGWAALYFTVYAMQAIPASRILFNPLLGAVLLLLVAVGMIVHSLRYRSEAVTGLAYFVTFATLAISPATTLSVIAVIPLAASLLYVAHRFSWTRMAAFGVFATYSTCASKGDSGAPLWQAQTLFAVYWLVLETFGLLRAARRTLYDTWEQTILPLNAFGFVALSYAKWSLAAPGHLYLLAAITGAAYLASAVIRTRVRPPSSFGEDETTPDRAMSGGYEGPITLTAILTAAAVLLKMHGAPAYVGLLLEAELFFLAGLFYREAYPRQLAAALFATALGKQIIVDIPAGGESMFAGLRVHAWTPAAALSAILFYLNRALRRTDEFYGYAGTAVLAVVLGFETPARWMGLAWFLLATAAFAFGWLRRLRHFRFQGYLTGFLGLAGLGCYHLQVFNGTATPARHPWIALSAAAVLSYLAVLCALRSAEDRLEDWERSSVRAVGSWSVTLLLIALVARMVPQAYIGLGWLAIALVLLEFGLRAWPVDFRRQSFVTAAAGVLGVYVTGILGVQNTGPWGPRLAVAAAAVLLYAFAARAFVARRAGRFENELGRATDLASCAGTAFALIGLWALLPIVAVAPAWVVLSLILGEIGLTFGVASFRLEAQIAGAASFVRLFFANFEDTGYTGVLSHRLLTVAPSIAAYYYAWWRERQGLWQFARWYLYAATVAATVLARFELGRMFTVAGWAVLVLALLAAGRRWKINDLRWQSYGLAALTFARCWSSNFYAPESFSGAAGRVAIGAIVIACLYGSELLSEREQPGLERYARLFYALLATSLLSVLLFHEVSGGMLTVAWGIEALALLGAGFPLRDRILRLLGLALFFLCILKLFFFDLRQLETLYRILSFIVLGAILVSVSWIYTRFRDRVERYL